MPGLPLDKEYLDAFEQMVEADNARTSAIVGVSILDVMLERVLKSYMRNLSRKESDRLFDGRGPLAGVSAKIDLGFALCAYDEHAKKDLIVLNRVRNRFAHDLHIHDFNHPEILELVGTLMFPRLKKHPVTLTFRVLMAAVGADPHEAAHDKFLQTTTYFMIGLSALLDHRGASLSPTTLIGLSY